MPEAACATPKDLKNPPKTEALFWGDCAGRADLARIIFLRPPGPNQ